MLPIKNSKNSALKAEKLPEFLLLKNVEVIDNAENLKGVKSIIIENGVIQQILDYPPKEFIGKVVEQEGLVVMPGWFDMHVHLREPGREDEETIVSGGFAAANGGFTGVACMPNTKPAIDTQEIVQYIKEQSADLPVHVYPVGAITKKRQGQELSPVAELVEAGAVAVSDDGSPVMNAELMRRALEYSKMFDIPILGHEEDSNLCKNGHMHEGYFSTKLGIHGIPSVSEEIMIARDIMLTEYTGGRFHICHISTKKAVELVRHAKDRGIAITCETTPHHFTLTDKEVESFETNTKMNPPLRSEEDRQAIIAGLKDGTIDVIATDHAPHSIEEKETEFIYAPFGITGLESALGLIIGQLFVPGIVSLQDLYRLCVVNPRKILNLPVPKIKSGTKAELTVFNKNEKWQLAQIQSCSKSVNTPFMQFPLTGKPVMVINKNMSFSGKK